MNRLLGRRLTAATFAVSTSSISRNYTYSDANNTSLESAGFSHHLMAVDDQKESKDTDCSVAEIDSHLELVSSTQTDHDTFFQYDNLVEHLANQPDLFNSLLPVNLLPRDREVALTMIFQKVRKIFSDRHLLAQITVPDTFPAVASACSTSDCEDSRWDDLVNDYKCMICSDLLAGPVILGCSHSFCGICLHNMRESWESDDSDITYSCPTCREDIENEIFERVLDEIIAQKVAIFRDCEPKRDWIKRREEFKNYQRNKILDRELNKNKSTESSFEDAQYINAAALVIIALILTVAAAAAMKSRHNS